MFLKSSDEAIKAIADREILEAITTIGRKAIEAFNSNEAYHDPEKIKEACLRALERLGSSQQEFYREMAPAYEVTYDPDTGETLCSFYMDVPYVEARVTLLKPEDQTQEEFDQTVDEIIADLNFNFAEYL